MFYEFRRAFLEKLLIPELDDSLSLKKSSS